MVGRELGLEARSSRIHRSWIWQHGGGYFGVPCTNDLVWFFTVYVFFELFALSLRFRRTGSEEEASAFPGSYYAQALIMYAVIGLAFVVAYLVGGGNTLVTDAAGGDWHIRSIAQPGVTVSIFTIVFCATFF